MDLARALLHSVAGQLALLQVRRKVCLDVIAPAAVGTRDFSCPFGFFLGMVAGGIYGAQEHVLEHWSNDSSTY